MASFENLFKPTIDRLAHLIMRQYGCQMEYLHLTELQRAVLPTLRHQLATGQCVSSGEHWFIPVFLNRRLAGAAQIHQVLNLSTNELRFLQQVVQTVIEATLLNLDRMELLEELEGQLKLFDQNQNVLPLSHFRPNPHPVRNKFGRNEDRSFDFPCLIESENTSDIFKMALELHNYANRYAFLPLKDLNSEIWSSFDQLQKIGNASVYIEDIFSLTIEQQKYLCEFLRSRVRRESPQIIVGTCTPYRELKTSSAIYPPFLDEVTIGYLHMSHPFSVYQKENLIDFFFEGLTGRTALNFEGHSHSLLDNTEGPRHH